ncbi:Oidioi.mRNA.OKI2018_I69.chr2.g4270.t1.cds [Oikopleura dioica]|uniref:Oidioi.mRNA.OKI2018_I69.chr2.g4270.t1.cds n=1 Tax=Oikopleura dioica TaxID=34765 RepID=A0ABN7T124_OIKDI|nr:Oidioi.mRNA.OKI2018_I69.chr2.g4270.t1.cds [Oikopleura dioica]
MLTEIIFSDGSSGTYENSFLEENYPFFKTLFEFDEAESSETESFFDDLEPCTKVALPMKMVTFEILDFSEWEVEPFLDFVGMETVKVANTIEDVLRQMTLLHMNKHLVKIGYGSVPDDLRRFVPTKLPVVDPKFRYVKFTPRKASLIFRRSRGEPNKSDECQVYTFFKNKKMVNCGIEILMIFEREIFDLPMNCYRSRSKEFSFKLMDLLPDYYKNYDILFNQRRTLRELYSRYPAKIEEVDTSSYSGNSLAFLENTEAKQLWKVKIRFWKKRAFVRNGIKASQKVWEEDKLVFLLYEDDESIKYIPSGEFLKKDKFVPAPFYGGY